MRCRPRAPPILSACAENRLIQVDGGATASYIYDAEGRRVQRTNGSTRTDFIYDQAGKVVLEVNATAGVANRWEIYALGRSVATYIAATTVFNHADWQGTVRAHSNVSGASAQTCTGLTFGDPTALTCTGTGTNVWGPAHFTGDEHDSESNLEHTWFRQYIGTQGRWMSPDPAGLAAVDLTNPQSLNRYAYVMNQPTNGIDPLGLEGPNTKLYVPADTDPFGHAGWTPFAFLGPTQYTLTTQWVAPSLSFVTSGTIIGDYSDILNTMSFGAEQLWLDGGGLTFTISASSGLPASYSFDIGFSRGAADSGGSNGTASVGQVYKTAPQQSRKYTDYLACAGTQWGADVMGTDLGPALVGAGWSSAMAKQIAKKAAVRTGTRPISGGSAFAGAAGPMSTVALVFDAYLAVRALAESVKVHDQCAQQVYGGW